MRTFSLFPVVLALALACKGEEIPTAEADTDTDADADSDADADADADSDTDSDTDTDTDTDADTDSGFIDSGDSGWSGPCVDDLMEPNDTPATAIASTGGVDLVVCPGGPDYWTFELADGEGVNVLVEFIHANGDVDIQLYDDAANFLDGSAGVTDNESVSYFNSSGAPMTLILHVYGWAGAQNTYDWSITTFTCTDDAFEPNDDLASATPLDNATGLNLIAGNPDVFEITVPAGDLADISVSFVNAFGDIDLRLLDATGQEIDASQNWNADTESVSWYNSTGAAATVYAEVTFAPFGNASCNEYDLSTVFTTFNCFEDAFEPNNILVDAVPTAGELGLGIALGDVDFWRVTTLPGQLTEIRVDPDLSQGSVFVELLNGNGAVISTGNPLYYLNNTAGNVDVFARVGLQSGVCTVYDLLVSDATPVCIPDAREPDNSEVGAVAIGTGRIDDLTVSAGDDDWSVYDLEPGHVLTAYLRYPAITGNANAYFRVGGNTVTDTLAQTGAPRAIAYENQSAGAEAVSVRISGNQFPLGCVPYSLELVEFECGALDAYEPNDDISTANPATSGTNGTVDDADQDFFSMGTVAPGATVTASVTFSSALADIDAELQDANGTTLVFSWFGQNEEVVTWTNTTGQPAEIYLMVERWPFGSTGCQSLYSFTSSVSP